MTSPDDLKMLITRAYLDTGKDSTVPELAKRAGVSESTIRRTLDACHGVPDGCQYKTKVYNVRAVNEYGPTRLTLRAMLLAAQAELHASKALIALADGRAP